MRDVTRTRPLFEAGDIIHDRYVVDHYVSKGGFAQVWKVTTEHSFMPLAMKVLHPSHREEEKLRFQLERDLMRGLNEHQNPRTPRVHWAGQAPHPRDDSQELEFIVMDFIKGFTLAEALQRGRDGMREVCGLHFEKGRLTYASFLTLMDQLLEGLTDIHALGCVHRDLKPRNILLASGGALNAKIIDFGIAKTFKDGLRELDFMDEEVSYERLTMEGSFVLSSHYSAPEQLFESAKCSPKTDLFALGLMAYECLVGEPVYSEDLDNEATLGEIVSTLQEPIRLPEDVAQLAPRVARLLHSMLEKGLSRRLDIMKDEQGALLYDLERDGGSLTRLVRQHVATLGRDADMLSQSLSSISPRPVEAMRQTDETERLAVHRPAVSSPPVHQVQPEEDLDTHLSVYDVERLARGEFQETKAIRSGLFDPLEDRKTIPIPLAEVDASMEQALLIKQQEEERVQERDVEEAWSFTDEALEPTPHRPKRGLFLGLALLVMLLLVGVGVFMVMRPEEPRPDVSLPSSATTLNTSSPSTNVLSNKEAFDEKGAPIAPALLASQAVLGTSVAVASSAATDEALRQKKAAQAKRAVKVDRKKKISKPKTSPEPKVGTEAKDTSHQKKDDVPEKKPVEYKPKRSFSTWKVQ